MLSDSLLTIITLGGGLSFILLPFGIAKWRQIFFFFLIYLAFEGLVRRTFPGYHQWIFIAKDLVLVPIYLGSLREYRRKHRGIKRTSALKIWPFFFFAYICLIHVFNPRNLGLIAAILSCKLYLWYLPLILVSYVYFESDEHIVESMKKISWILIPVCALAFVQAVTGWGTAARSSDSVMATGGTNVRGNYGGGETIVTISSTFIGGRLGPFAAVWTLILLSLFLYSYKASNRDRFYFLTLSGCAFLSLILGINNTAMASTLLGMILLWLHALKTLSLGRLFRNSSIVGVVAAVFLLIMTQFLSDGQQAVVNTSSLKSFFSGLLEPESRKVVTVNIWEGMRAGYELAGFWGRGVGVFSQAGDYIQTEDNDVGEIVEFYRTESQLLRLLIEVGVPGLCVYIWAYASLLGSLVKFSLKCQHKFPQHSIILMGSTAVLILYFIMSYKHHGFASDPTLQTYVYFFVGVGFRVISEAQRQSLQMKVTKNVL